MIRANCRARFTAADFDFVVRTLARSATDHVSLVDLLSDSETRDSVLDNPRLVNAILSNAGHLQISSQFYFYVLARHVLRQAGMVDRKLCERQSSPGAACAWRFGKPISFRYAHCAHSLHARTSVPIARARRQLFALH